MYNSGQLVDGYRIDLTGRGPNDGESTGQVELDASGNVTAVCAGTSYVNYACR